LWLVKPSQQLGNSATAQLLEQSILSVLVPLWLDNQFCNWAILQQRNC
jgi:hypothetical protein